MDKKKIKYLIERINRKTGGQSFSLTQWCKGSNPLPDIPIYGSSNSATNKDMMSKPWTNGDTII